jgi:hypothetical protein
MKAGTIGVGGLEHRRRCARAKAGVAKIAAFFTARPLLEGVWQWSWN